MVDADVSSAVLNSESPLPDILLESWKAYVQRFIQEDGRVIDHRAGDISTSEIQAYTMLRAVWLGDRINFEKTYAWAVNNLNSSIRNDHLWAWKWGKDASTGKWQVLDRAFASDAEEDAALALILASRIWSEPKYLDEARQIVSELWYAGTVVSGGRRYLLAGESADRYGVCTLNPSYVAPYAYRMFSNVDKSGNWTELVDSSYYLLESVSALTETHLPPDWVQLNVRTGKLSLGTPVESRFSYDAFRVYWRVEMDWALNRDPRADRFLRYSLAWIIDEWKKQEMLPAVISAGGTPEAQNESLEMLSGIMAAVDNVNQEVAAMMNLTVGDAYSNGFWGDRDNCYLQNWAWFGRVLYYRFLAPLRRVPHAASLQPHA